MTTTAVDLGSYDLIVINTSAGKDSQAMLTHLMHLAEEQGVSRDKFLAVHCDLGRVEWEGTRELAEEQAQSYGLRFQAVSRPQGDLLEQIEARGMFPSSTARYCTSDQKTGQVSKVLTAETKRLQAEGIDRQVRILNTLGIRAEESPARAKKQSFHKDSASNGKRHVDRWLPIFDWDEERVWDTIWASGLPWHKAYDLGMPRLSCVFCVLAGDKELVLAAQHNPDLAAEYVAVEERIGHTFKNGRSMADIVALAQEKSRELRSALKAS